MMVSYWLGEVLFSVLLILLCSWFYFISGRGGLFLCIMKNSLICLLCFICVMQLWCLMKLCLVMILCVIVFMCVCSFGGVISRMLVSVWCMVLSGVIIISMQMKVRMVGLMYGLIQVSEVFCISMLLRKVSRQQVDMLVVIIQFFVFSVMNFELMWWLVCRMNLVSVFLLMMDSLVKVMVGFSVMWWLLDISVLIVLISVYSVVLIISVLFIFSMIGFRCQKFMVKCWLSCDCSVLVLVESVISCVISSDSQVIIMLIRLQMLLKMISEELVSRLNIIVVVVSSSEVVIDRCSMFCLVVGLKNCGW